jgi:hypothetical protein
VEKATGQVFEVRPTTFYLSGGATGSVYELYYGEAAKTVPYRDLKLSYSGGSIMTNEGGAFSNAPGDAQPRLDGFEGKRVKIVPMTGDKVTVAGTRQGSSWSVLFEGATGGDLFADKAMAQSMTYYHLNKEINHAKRYISTPWLDEQLTANVNLAKSCNAFWDGSTVNLFSAGKGCANTALIADVFYHEWGHGLDDNTGGVDDGAFSEGFGDMMALMMTHSPIIGHGFKVEDGAPVRELTDLKVYPDDQDFDPHKEGLIIAGAFYDLFLALQDRYGETEAGDILSRFALKVVFTASKYTDVYDALLVLDDDGSRAARSPNFCLINAAFARHGLAEADAGCH